MHPTNCNINAVSVVESYNVSYVHKTDGKDFDIGFVYGMIAVVIVGLLFITFLYIMRSRLWELADNRMQRRVASCTV